MSSEAIKKKGQIYTPDFIVGNILDLVNYKGDILRKHIIDNSCGDGAFLREIVRRYCDEYIGRQGGTSGLVQELEKYIHGIEIDEDEHQKCIANLNDIAKSYHLETPKWSVVRGDALLMEEYKGLMDFVVGNPPYVRVHNLCSSYDAVKKFSFSQKGMTDLYIVFYEIGFDMMAETGKMCLITPSSWLSSKAGSELRKFVQEVRSLVAIVDLGHYQAFRNATTYTMITMFDRSVHHEVVNYYGYDEGKKEPKLLHSLSYSEIFINGKIFLGDPSSLKRLRSIEDYYAESAKSIQVKNGFATLADKVFIGDFKSEEGTIDVIKASTGKWTKCLFPYDEQGSPLTAAEFSLKKECWEHLSKHKPDLLDRSNENEWYLFGRTQALRDVQMKKIAVNSLFKDTTSLKIAAVPGGSGVYSGLYIISPHTIEEITDAMTSSDFMDYLRLLKNYKSGGYFTFSSKDLAKYLTYALGTK